MTVITVIVGLLPSCGARPLRADAAHRAPMIGGMVTPRATW